ncbi:hypothetical protein VTN77DRAFT_8925 [Rasamsonia byssochlamydoides]|uniref:uncharacterized protein n=1 Tax=Rasamsonia byssochlamydoides TaxID=89139 RepID=UPI0037424EE2
MPLPSNVYRVHMDYIPALDDEIELRVGQLVRLLHVYDDGWTQCANLDGSRKGIAPRSCLSTHPLQPRSNGQGPRGPPIMGPNGRPMSPAGGRKGPGPAGPPRFYQDGRPMTPKSSAFPAPLRPQQGPPMSPVVGPVEIPRPLTPGGSSRSPQSPASSGPAGMPRPASPNQRNRSNSTSTNNGRPNGPPGPSPLAGTPTAGPSSPPQGPIERKPVPGQAI